MNDYNFGNFLCMLREQKGFTQSEIAQMLSVTPAAVSKWENGESKPRIETLFQLAEILDVAAEELMAGKFLRTEAPNDEQVEAIRRRYEYLTRIDRLLTSKVRFKRIAAFFIDLFVSLMLFSAVVSIFAVVFEGSKMVFDSPKELLENLSSLALIGWLICFVFRDLIFRGRSIGKRIFGLMVIDRNNGEKAKKRQLIIRNVFFFLYSIDGIVMLVRGISIGDSVAQTLVVSKKQWEELEVTGKCDTISEINAYRNPKAETKKAIGIIAVICLGFVLFSGFIFGTVMLSLNRAKETEQYAVAYNYIIESGVLEKNGLNEENLKLNSYSTQTSLNSGKSYAELGFWVDGVKILVVCHNEGEEWYVCENCTFAGEKVCPQF